jgi:hypothetical protein
MSRNLKKLTSTLVSAILMLAMVAPVFAQGTTDGTIAGVVADAQGAVISGAKVTAKNIATGQMFNATTSDGGTFRFNNVPVGNYTLSIEVQNFKTYSNPDVQVQLNRVTDVNAIMEPGAVSEVVTVTSGAAAELVETTTSQLGKSFEDRKVIELPIGQDQNALALLSPNVVTNGSGVLGQGGSVGGNRPRNNSFNLDGIDNNDISVTGPQIAPIQDAVKEFTILTNQFSAEFGRSSAGQFNTITKTGTNSIHGDLWWYNVNKHLRSLDHRFKEAEADDGRFGDDVQRPRDDFNRIGGDIGGPILKDKLFYFGAFQYQTRGTAGSTVTFGAPTAQGFNILESLGGVSDFTLNLLRTHVPPAAAQGRDPDGNLTFVDVLGQDIPFGQLLVLVPNFFNLYQWHVNIDYNLSQNDRLYGRFFYDRLRAPLLGTPGPEFTGSQGTDNRLFSITYNHNFSSTLINELRFGYRRQVASFNVPLEFADFPGEFPNVNIDELGLIIGPNGNAPQSSVTNVYQMANTASWTKGRHQMKFGADYRNAIAPGNFLPRQRGEYSYQTLEDFLRDVKPEVPGSNGLLRGVGSGFFAGNQWAIYPFFQNDFKWKPNVTLNLGLRYEYTSNARDAKLQELNAISNLPADDPVLQEVRQIRGLEGYFPDGIIFRTPKTDKNNFAPRIGFAWAPDYPDGWMHKIFGDSGQSSIRAGFSLAYDVLFQNLVLLQLPPQLQQEINALDGVGGAFGSQTAFLQNGGIPTGVVPSEFFTDRDLARAFTGSIILDTQTPYTMAWSLTYQRELAQNWSVELRYLGNRGINLFVQSQLNAGRAPGFNLPTFFNESEIPTAGTLGGLPSRQQFLNARGRLLADAGFGSALTGFPAQGSSTYHGGSINVKRRLTSGFTLDASYTFSRTIDNITNELFSSSVNPRRPENNLDLQNERAQSVLSRPHRLAIGWIWEVPFYKNERGFLGHLLGNWQVSGIYQAESGQLVDALSFNDANGNLDSAGDRTVLNVNGDPSLGTGVNWVTRTRQIINPDTLTPAQQSAISPNVVAYVAQNSNAQFVFADAGARTTAGRNLIRAPGINNWDLSVFKRFPITENHRLEFRAEMFNAFNHPQFVIDDPFALDYVNVRSPNFQNKRLFSGNPFGSIPSFGLITNPIAGGNPRVIQLVLRYGF